jgi:hypothetical protein
VDQECNFSDFECINMLKARVSSSRNHIGLDKDQRLFIETEWIGIKCRQRHGYLDAINRIILAITKGPGTLFHHYREMRATLRKNFVFFLGEMFHLVAFYCLQ